MKTFRFTLESVATLRQSREQVATGKYAEALLALAEAMQKLEAVEHELALGQREYKRSLLGGTTTSRVAQHEFYCANVQRKREQAVGSVKEARAALERALQAMLQARRDCEGVEKMREKQVAVHNRELMRAEQKETDEMAGRQLASGLNWKNNQYD